MQSGKGKNLKNKINAYKFAMGAWVKVEALLEAVIAVSEVGFHLMILNAGLILLFNEVEYNGVLDVQNIACNRCRLIKSALCVAGPFAIVPVLMGFRATKCGPYLMHCFSSTAVDTPGKSGWTS